MKQKVKIIERTEIDELISSTFNVSGNATFIQLMLGLKVYMKKNNIKTHYLSGEEVSLEDIEKVINIANLLITHNVTILVDGCQKIIDKNIATTH